MPYEIEKREEPYTGAQQAELDKVIDDIIGIRIDDTTPARGPDTGSGSGSARDKIIADLMNSLVERDGTFRPLTDKQNEKFTQNAGFNGRSMSTHILHSFDYIDNDNDGYVSREEVEHGIRRELASGSKETTKLLYGAYTAFDYIARLSNDEDSFENKISRSDLQTLGNSGTAPELNLAGILSLSTHRRDSTLTNLAWVFAGGSYIAKHPAISVPLVVGSMTCLAGAHYKGYQEYRRQHNFLSRLDERFSPSPSGPTFKDFIP